MSKLNLEEVIPGALWVDKDRGMYVRRDPGDNDRFYACHPESGNQYGYYTTKQRAAQDLEALIEPTLAEQDEEWVKTKADGWVTTGIESWKNGWRAGASSGILHERDRVRALLTCTYLGKHQVKDIRDHLGLDKKP